MFRGIILPIFRNTRLCVTACGIMHPQCCRPVTGWQHLVVCLYYLYQWCTVNQISDNEICLLIKYIKSVLWRVAERLSYIQDARCIKVNIISSFIDLLNYALSHLETNTRPLLFHTCCLYFNVHDFKVPLLSLLIFPTSRSSLHELNQSNAHWKIASVLIVHLWNWENFDNISFEVYSETN